MLGWLFQKWSPTSPIRKKTRLIVFHLRRAPINLNDSDWEEEATDVRKLLLLDLTVLFEIFKLFLLNLILIGIFKIFLLTLKLYMLDIIFIGIFKIFLLNLIFLIGIFKLFLILIWIFKGNKRGLWIFPSLAPRLFDFKVLEGWPLTAWHISIQKDLCYLQFSFNRVRSLSCLV